MPVINIIKRFVQKRGITAYQFGKDTGIAQNTAYALFNNPHQRPSPSVLDKVCDFYEIQPSEILKWVPPSELKEEDERERPAKKV